MLVADKRTDIPQYQACQVTYVCTALSVPHRQYTRPWFQPHLCSSPTSALTSAPALPLLSPLLSPLLQRYLCSHLRSSPTGAHRALFRRQVHDQVVHTSQSAFNAATLSFCKELVDFFLQVEPHLHVFGWHICPTCSRHAPRQLQSSGLLVDPSQPVVASGPLTLEQSETSGSDRSNAREQLTPPHYPTVHCRNYSLKAQ